jgi:outer membrane protein OmpA-like peptidoglycan-associated protein
MINIQLSSHTDCRGNEIYNQELSQKRAQSARDFLIAEGIEGNRITAVGYGENRLLIDCKCERCTEEEHQLNRRTTFKVVSDNP